jgi:hypothetical protein
MEVDAVVGAVAVVVAVAAAVTSPLVLGVGSMLHGVRSIGRRRMAFLGLANELNGQAGEV